MKKHVVFFILSIFAISTVGVAETSSTQIGNSFFTAKSSPSEEVDAGQNPDDQIGNSYFSKSQTKTISQVGPSVEAHQNYINFFVFVNQLCTNHLFYELRGYATYDYISQNPPAPPLVPTIIPVSSERNLMGYGGVGILGYNININKHVSFLPFVRLQRLTNTFAAYSDSFGNAVSSVNYAAFLGGKLSMRVTQIFAIYAQYYAGYQKSLLSGRGIFSTAGNPTVNALASVIEFGAPYKINKSLSITPYLVWITAGINPNQVSRDKPYSISQLTNPNNAYGIKLGYDF